MEIAGAVRSADPEQFVSRIPVHQVPSPVQSPAVYLMTSRDRSSCLYVAVGGTAAAVPPPFRLGDPALCWSHPLVTL